VSSFGLIVIDDIGLLPITAETAAALYWVVDAAYEKRSIALQQPSPRRLRRAHAQDHRQRNRRPLMHHAHVVLTAGDSIRLTQATAGQGVTPLTHQPRAEPPRQTCVVRVAVTARQNGESV
jgi:DNA replication protein DnaC